MGSAFSSFAQGNLSRQKPVKVFDPINDTVKSLLYHRQSEYSSALPITIWVGTYNLNGRMPPASNTGELMRWLWPNTGWHILLHS